jgi:hypothetical protein
MLNKKTLLLLFFSLVAVQPAQAKYPSDTITLPPYENLQSYKQNSKDDVKSYSPYESLEELPDTEFYYNDPYYQYYPYYPYYEYYPYYYRRHRGDHSEEHGHEHRGGFRGKGGDNHRGHGGETHRGGGGSGHHGGASSGHQGGGSSGHHGGGSSGHHGGGK